MRRRDVVTLEHRGQIARPGQGIGRAVAKIETGPATALPEPRKRVAGDRGRFRVVRNHVHPRAGHRPIGPMPPCLVAGASGQDKPYRPVRIWPASSLASRPADLGRQAHQDGLHVAAGLQPEQWCRGRTAG